MLSTLYQKKMVTEQEVEDLKPAKFPVCHLLVIQCTKSLDVVKRTAEVLAEWGHDVREKLQLIGQQVYSVCCFAIVMYVVSRVDESKKLKFTITLIRLQPVRLGCIMGRSCRIH